MVRWVVRLIPNLGPTELLYVSASAPRLVYKGHCTYYPVCGMVHITEHMLLIGKKYPMK